MRGMGNMEPNMDTVRPASAPTATMYLHFMAPTCPNISTSAESASTSSYGTATHHHQFILHAENNEEILYRAHRYTEFAS